MCVFVSKYFFTVLHGFQQFLPFWDLTMEIQTKYIAAGCNCTYNCHVLTEDFIFFGSNHSLAAYDLKVERKWEKLCFYEIL